MQAPEHNHAGRESKVSYWTLLQNPPMAVICCSRLADPMWTTSIYSYLFFQLRYLSPNASEAAIATQAGVIVGARTFAKVCTGVLWGVLADSTGRKGVMFIGLFCSGIAAIGYGFSTTFSTAIFWQVVHGAVNSNVAMARTMLAELFRDADPKVRSRSLLLLVLVSSFGMLIGPLVGGFANSRKGLGRLSDFPYALPNLIIGSFYGIAALGILLLVPETLDRRGLPRSATSQPNLWRNLRKFIPSGPSQKYESVTDYEQQIPLTSAVDDQDADGSNVLQHTKPTWRQILTPQVISTMITQFIITGHIATFGTLWSVFLSTPVAESPMKPAEGQQISTSLLFGGGVGLRPPQIGLLMTCATIVGIAIQLFLLHRLIERMGTIRVWRRALWLFPVAYFLAPFPALMASTYRGSPDTAKGTSSGPAIVTWISLAIIIILFMIARTGAQPPMVILINECVPHPSTRGTVNTIATTAASLARSTFPITVMAVYGAALRGGFVAAAFWLLSLLAFVAVAASRWVAKGLDDRAVLKKKRADGDAARDDATM